MLYHSRRDIHTKSNAHSPTDKLPSHLSSLLLELFDCSLVDTATLVDEMAGGGGLSRIDVADNHDVDMCLLLGHGELFL